MRRFASIGLPLPTLVGVGFVGLILGAAIVGLALGGSGDDQTASTAPSTTAAATTDVADEPDRADTTAVRGPVVRPVIVSDEVFHASHRVLGGLKPATVLRVEVGGFEPFAAAGARQCIMTDLEWCGNRIGVQFDRSGRAQFQYLVTDDFHSNVALGGRCRAGSSRCLIVIETPFGRRTRAELDTVFSDVVDQPGRINVAPASGLKDGSVVQVSVVGYPPGAEVEATLCAPPAASGIQRCGAPGPTAPLVVGPDGRGTTNLEIRIGPLGTERAPCGPRATCGISVASDTVFARAPVVEISFAAPPGAEYHTWRVALGIVLATAFLAAAAWWILRTDWSPVGEAAAPEIDDAEYADLDAIVAAMPPEDELVDIS